VGKAERRVVCPDTPKRLAGKKMNRTRIGNVAKEFVEPWKESAGRHYVLLMMTRAPSLPSTPRSLALGLLSRPFLRLRKPSMPEGFSVGAFCTSAEL
jgi:hypothetical protein